VNQGAYPSTPAGVQPRAAAQRTGAAWIVVGWLVCVVLACGLTLYVNPHSLTGYWYYLAGWLLFITLFDRHETRDFVSAYLVNAVLTAAYVLAQVHFYPASYGCTSPFGAQTDDSFFFSLVADEIPPGMETRDGYFLYTYGFSSVVRMATPFRVLHPLDVLFFLSGVAGLVSVYSQQLAVQLTSSRRAGRLAYLLALFCPMMLMNGGAVFVRDTFVAGLLVLSFCCLHRRRYFAFSVCVALQFVLRPGTGLMIMVLYALMFVENLRTFFRTKTRRVSLCVAVLLLGIAARDAGYLNPAWLTEQLEQNGVVLNEFRREGQAEIIASGYGKGAFTAIQKQNLPLRITLSTVYMYLAPFFSLNRLQTPDGFDSRILLMNVIYPFWVLPVHAWIFAALFASKGVRLILGKWMLMFVVACFLIGVFSLQSRHRVIIQPLFYVLAAIGAHFGPPRAKLIGFGLAGLWITGQLVYYFFF
jgi:hypothetical protein